MQSIVKALLVAAGLAAAPALAVTTGPGYHCVNAKGKEVKGASTAAQCTSPYRWVKTTAQAAKKPAKHVASAKQKKRPHVASSGAKNSGKVH